jgi:predicted transcriptional regulator
MKIKTIKIQTLEEGLQDFADAFHKAQTGKGKSAKTEVFFTSLEAARRVLTPERFKVLRFIKENKPNSIYEVAKGLKKDMKNISQDLRFLAEVGLVELTDSKASRNQKKPVLLSDHIRFEFLI